MTTPEVHEATARGALHARDGRPNQDAARVCRLADGTVVAAVADGHGSAALAEVGARVAVDLACHRLAELWVREGGSAGGLLRCAARLEAAVLERLTAAWRRCVEVFAGVEPEASETRPELLRPFGTTLLAALIRPEGALTLQLGDGAVWATGPSGDVPLEETPPEDDIGDQTDSLTMRDAARRVRLRLFVRDRGEAAMTLMLATDGFQKSYPDDATAALYLEGIHAMAGRGEFEEVGTHLPRWVGQMAREGAGDDTTMVLVHWPAAHPKAAEAHPLELQVEDPPTTNDPPPVPDLSPDPAPKEEAPDVP